MADGKSNLRCGGVDTSEALPAFGRRRSRTGFIARRAAEDLAPYRMLEAAVRDAALGRGVGSPG